MRILLDHNVPVPLRKHLSRHEVVTASYMGWYNKRNGVLLKLAEDNRFDLLVTCDTSMSYQQRMTRRKIGICVLTKTHWQSIKQEIERISSAIDKMIPGSYQELLIPARHIGKKGSERISE